MKNFKLGFLALFFLLIASKVYSQACTGNQVTITLQNITNPTTTTLEFDVYVSNTGSTTLKLAALAGNVIYNNGMLPATATGTFSCIEQPTAGNFPNFNVITMNHTPATFQLRWQSTPVSLSSGNTINLPVNTPLKFARFKFTSSIPWTANFPATLTEYNQIGGGFSQIIATVYCGNPSNATSTGLSASLPGSVVYHNATNSPYPITLNACAIAASQTASTAVSCFGGSNGSSTITMSPIPSVSAITYTVDGGTSQSATLTSGAFTVTGLTAGSHTIVISNSICSNVTATGVTISGPTLLVASGAPTTILCNGGNSTVVVTATGGTAPYTGTGSFTHAAGAYSYTVTDNKGCTAVASGTISQPALLVASAVPSTILCNGGSSTVFVSASGGTTPYTANTIGSFQHLAGAYSYTVRDFKGCTSTASGTISQPAALTATATAGTIACNGGTTDVTVTPSGGTAPYVITPSTTGLSAGTYTFTITDFNNCTTTANVTITQPDALTATATAGTITCNGGTTNATVTPAGGTAPYTITPSATGLTAGTYTFTVTDFNNCTTTADVTITQPDSLTATATAGTIACYGGTTDATVTPAGGTAPYTITPSTVGLTAGTHTFTITDFNNCTTTADVTISQPDALTATATAGIIACNGGTTDVTVTPAGGTAPYTISPSSIGLIAGTYTFTITDFNNCTTTANVTITQPDALTATATAGTITCNGGTTNATVTPAGGTAPYTITPSATGLTAGTYTFTITDFNNCTTTADVTITEPAVLTATANAGTIACNGGSTSITVSANGGTAPFTGTGTFTVSAGPYSYTVTDANGCTSIASGTITEPTTLVASESAGTITCNGGTTTITISANGGTAPFSGIGTFTVSAGPYSYTVTDANGCTSIASGTLTQPATSVASASAGTIACYGGTTTITISANGGTAPFDGTGTFTVNAGPYSYTVTDANGCTSIASGTITQPTALVASASPSTISCNGSNSTVTVSATGGTAPYVSTSIGTFTHAVGDYSYTVTDANGCTALASGTITQPTALVASASTSTISCFGGNSTITVSATGGTTPYLTSSVGSFTHAAGAYSYTVTDANGCTAVASGTITQPTALVASASPSAISCFGGNSTVTVSATGGTTPYLTASVGSFTHAAGAYSYTVTDANGCTALASGTITEPTALVASASAGTIACNGGTTSITVSANGGTAPFTGTGTFTVSAGPYSYTVTDANGCTSIASGTITEPEPLTTSTTISACDTYTWNGTTYTISGEYTYNSTNGSGCSVVNTLYLTINNSTTSSETQATCAAYTWHGTTYTTSGNYTYTSTNASGCDNVATLYLTFNTTTTSETQVACDGYTWNGTTYTVSGEYTYNSTNTAGCLNVATLYLTINHITTPVFNAVAPICIGTALSNLPTTSNQGLTGSWLPSTMNNNATTTYTFTPSPGQCAAVSQMTIQVFPLASAPTAAANQYFNLGDTLTTLIVTVGSNLTWYDSQASTTSIPSSTTLIDGTTYYVSQTINGCEGPKTAITVNLNLGVDQNQLISITYSPNPVVDVLVVKSNELIENITVFNTLGQLLFTLTENANEFSVDLSNLPTGSYFIKAQTEDLNQVFKVIKK